MADRRSISKKKDKKQPKISSVVYIFPNGDKYDGQCVQTENGSIERIGQGTHTSALGFVYEGTWENDRMNGKGKMTQPSNAVYEGDFVNNQFHGFGRYTWPNGSYYEGPFVENRLEGEGIFVDTEGQTWEGNFHFKAAPGLQVRLTMH